MTQTVKKSSHVIAAESLAVPEDVTPYIPDNVSTALVPVQPEDVSIQVVNPADFANRKAHRMMKESYTGANTVSLKQMDRRDGKTYLVIKGAHIEHVEARIDEKTGELKPPFDQVLLKLEDDRVVSCGGVMAEKWARNVIADYGDYDWPESIQVVVNNHQGKEHEYPKFQTIG